MFEEKFKFNTNTIESKKSYTFDNINIDIGSSVYKNSNKLDEKVYK